MPGGAFGDSASGAILAGGIAAAIAQRERTGKVSVVETALLNTGMWQMQPAIAACKERQQAVIDQFNLTPSDKILALCPGAEYGKAKRWPTSYYAKVARHKIDKGWQVWLFGSAKDKADAEQINRETSGLCTDFTGKTSLPEAVDLLSLAHTVVTNDSGLMHIAAALDKRIIALYGSSDPGFTPPLNDKAQIVSLKLGCSPCFKRECPFGHTDCLTGITPKQVLELIAATDPAHK